MCRLGGYVEPLRGIAGQSRGCGLVGRYTVLGVSYALVNLPREDPDGSGPERPFAGVPGCFEWEATPWFAESQAVRTVDFRGRDGLIAQLARIAQVEP